MTLLRDQSSGSYREVLFRISTVNWGVVDSFTFRSPATGGGLIAGSAVLSPDGKRVSFMGADNFSPALFSFDIDSHEPLFRTPIETSFGETQVSPDGREVWITQSFITFYSPWPKDLGYVVMFDANTGAATDTLRTLGLNLANPGYPIPVFRMAFHPEGGKVYVTAQTGRPAILVVDVASKEVASTIYDYPEQVWDLAVAPR
jgi:DNA-binding beta-propeller fold protein YncE